jgi:hypothetical protein
MATEKEQHPLVDERFSGVFDGRPPVSDASLKNILDAPEDPELDKTVKDYLAKHGIAQNPEPSGQKD